MSQPAANVAKVSHLCYNRLYLAWLKSGLLHICPLEQLGMAFVEINRDMRNIIIDRKLSGMQDIVSGRNYAKLY